jgi:S-adenosylmethionine:tRNA ribosyltransferase-isomerase
MDRTSDYEYDLPAQLIAQTPVPRGESRLLVLDRTTGQITLGRFADLVSYLRPDDVLVVNDTRVTARRLTAEMDGGVRGEVLLLRPCGETEWEALVYPGRRMKPGTRVQLLTGERRVAVRIVDRTPDGGRIISMASREERDALMGAGAVPLPPYIHEPLSDEERYQTVYAARGGSAAAPTAGLHFSEEMLAQMPNLGVQVVRVTLHVGVDTFRPVRHDDPALHPMHGEWYSIDGEAAARLQERRGRVIAVGTTVVRALESAADDDGALAAKSGVTRLFIRPGYRFKVVDAMLTNFHLPRSTLLMLVSAFAGRDAVLNAYRRAVEEGFRFYSFGDAMLIVGEAPA